MINKKYLNDLIRNSLISISISIGIIFSLEIIYRVLRSKNFSFSQINQDRLKFQKIAFDNKYSFKEIIELNNSIGVNTGINYQPWIQIGNKNHRNKFSIVENGNRKTTDFKIKCDDPKVIWFFGGSTTYGTGVGWSETLPSMFAKELDNNNICAKVFNFGVPFHYSLQESFYMAIEIAKGDRPKPEFVLFIDGLNDFIQVGSSTKKEPFFTPTIKKSFNSDVDLKLNMYKPIISINFAFIEYIKRKIGLQGTLSNYQKPKNLSENLVTSRIVNTVFKSNQFRSNICKMYKIKCYQFLQPVPLINYEKIYDENLTFPSNNNLKNRFKRGYEMILRTNDQESIKNIEIHNISEVFLNYKNGIPYLDSFHYSPRANQYLAKKIYKIVFEK